MRLKPGSFIVTSFVGEYLAPTGFACRQLLPRLTDQNLAELDSLRLIACKWWLGPRKGRELSDEEGKWL